MTDRNAVVGASLDDAGSTFAEQSHLTYMIPSETDINLEATFKGIREGETTLEDIEQRESLYFDETVDVLLILKTPWRGDQDLQSRLRRLIVSLKARLVNTSASGRDASAESEVFFTGDVPNVTDAFIAVAGGGAQGQHANDHSDQSTQIVYAVWKLPVYLTRPRSRLPNPSVVFTASASQRPEVAAELNSRTRGGYLPSGFPSGLNLLESFGGDPALGGVKPRLSALRVSSVTPLTRQQDLMRPIRALPQLKFRVLPVLHARIRLSRPAASPPSAAVIALLEIEFTAHVDYEALLNTISLTTADGTIESLNDDAGMQLPLSCVSHDHITFLYHIKPHESDVPRKPSSSAGTLHISISASVQVVPGVAMPRLTLSWNSPLDFSPPVNPNFGQAPDSGIQRSHRPAQLSLSSNSSQTVSPLKSPSTMRPDAIPALEASTTRTEAAAAAPDMGITMSFNVPSGPVRPGQVFSWIIYVVNRSTEKSTRPPRKLALVAVPRRRRNEARPVRPPSSSSKRRGEKQTADAVLDENILHAMQKNSAIDAADVVCLSADTRVGPLAPGACHVVELQFLALREGVLGIEAIRVIDLGSQEHVDIRDLPTMIVEPAAA